MQELLAQTYSRFPQYDGLGVDVQPLEKGGSDRKFYRLTVGGGTSLILAKYGCQRDENRHYVNIAQFLNGVGVRVPQIFFHDEDEGLIWMEDLGDRDLWSYRNDAWPVRRALYFDALDQLLILHTRAHLSLTDPAPNLQADFNHELYRWEQNYFRENCLGRVFRIEPEILAAQGPRLEEIMAILDAKPRILVHRDFQSQNIVIKEGRACLIDFQGMRFGLPQYDLASLLLDPYVSLTAVEQDELIDYYLENLRALGGKPERDFRATFELCAMQRLMQALGAYGFLGIAKERTHFLEHIPAALASLKGVVNRIPGLDGLGQVLADLGPSSPSSPSGPSGP